MLLDRRSGVVDVVVGASGRLRQTRPATRGVAVLFLVLVAGAWLRVPQIGAGLPFLYDWDEPLNYRRVVSIAQSGNFNPYFFNYPSLDFYLRVPAVAGGFLWSARVGEMRSIQEIVTDYPPPGAAMARTVSHPRVLMWARSVSTLLSLLTIAVTFLVAVRVARSWWTAVAAAGLVACSPALIEHSARVAPDTLMAFLCLTTVWLAWRAMEYPAGGRAAVAGFAAGLAVSAKYNALPVVLVPVIACLLSDRRSPGTVTAALLMPIVGFLVGTPYALVTFPAFLDGVAFEIVHYGIEGHGGATVDSWRAHAWAFLGWMTASAGGAMLTIFAPIGALVLLAGRWRTGLMTLAFPVGFLLLMLSQRVAFFRNMLVIVPFAAILAAWAVERIGTRVRLRAAAPVLVLLVAVQPIGQAVWERYLVVTRPESRHAVIDWLAAVRDPLSDTAVAADLHLRPRDYAAPGVARVGADIVRDPVRMFLDGYDRVVVGPNVEPDSSLVRIEHVFPGEPHLPTVPQNPAVTVYGLPTLLARSSAVRERVESGPRYSVTLPGAVRSRVARVRFAEPLPYAGGSLTVDLSLRTPWPSQSCWLEIQRWRSRDLCDGLTPGEWERRTTIFPDGLLPGDVLWVIVRHVHAANGGRLGIEIRAGPVMGQPARRHRLGSASPTAPRSPSGRSRRDARATARRHAPFRPSGHRGVRARRPLGSSAAARCGRRCSGPSRTLPGSRLCPW